MKAIAITNQKGEVGKVTVARNLAFFAIEHGLRILCVDLDPQKNFSKALRVLHERTVGDQGDKLQSLTGSALSDGEATELQPLPYGESAALVATDRELVDVASHPLEDLHVPHAAPAKLTKGFNVRIIDTAPTLGNPLYAALIVADFVVCPCAMDQGTIDGLGGLFEDIARVQQLEWNTGLVTLDPLANHVNTHHVFDRNALEQLHGELGEVMMEGVLYDRTTTQYAKDRPVWCIQSGESQILTTREVKAVCNQIFNKAAI